MDSMSHNARIKAAITDLESQRKPKYAATARNWNIDKSTLWRRHQGETKTMEEANTESRQNLSRIQEEVLIEHCNRLTDRGIPPTPQILTNIAEELAKKKLGHNWATRFYDRHGDRLTSVYLRRIDHNRKKADNSRYFRYFFDSVRHHFNSLRQRYGYF
jgi:hypothetical protein